MRSSVVKAHKVLVHLSLLPTPPHLSSYQVSFGSLHCFLKMDRNFSDILYMPQINNNKLIGMLSMKLSGDKVQKEKQLVLCNLKEAYINLKETRPDIAIIFSKFSELPVRPKWCVPAGAYGTHITCVCTVHQNMKRMMQLIDRCSCVEEMISMCMCNTENEKCMYGVCTSCPGIETQKVSLQSELDDMTTEYKQWE
jgi:hypothetical protein